MCILFCDGEFSTGSAVAAELSVHRKIPPPRQAIYCDRVAAMHASLYPRQSKCSATTSFGAASAFGTINAKPDKSLQKRGLSLLPIATSQQIQSHRHAIMCDIVFLESV